MKEKANHEAALVVVLLLALLRSRGCLLRLHFFGEEAA